MKKLLLFGSLLYITVGYSQDLHKVQEVKDNTTEKVVLNIPKKSGISASSLSESFESTTFPPTGWTVFTFAGSGWSRETVGTPLPLWEDTEITTPAGGGNAVAYCTYSNDSTFNDQWLVTPLIQDIQSQDTLYFWMRNQIYDYSDTVYIYYTIDGTNFNLIGQVNYPEAGDTNWGKWYLHLGQYITAGSSVYIGFREFLYDNQINGGAISLDLIEIKGTETSAVPTVTTNNPSNITSSSATLNGAVNPNNSSTTVTFEYGTSTDYGNEITAAQSPVDGNSDVSVSANLSGLQPNTTYHYRVRGTNSVGISGGADVTFNTSQTSTTTININNSFTFNDPTQSSSYRMIGLPGDDNLPPTQFISGTHKSDWNMFYDNGNAENYLEEYNGSATFNFTPGKGFWVLSRNAININTEVNKVTLAADNTYSISLHSGWNIISNPFEKTVSLADIQNVNGLAANAIIYAFNGGNFTQPTTMLTYEGYYFNNVTGLTSLKVPYPSTGLLKAPGPSYSSSERNLTLKLSTKEFSSDVMIGFEPTASNDYDEMDYFAPPGDFEELRIIITNNNLSPPCKQLFIEHRPEIEEGQEFELQIKNATGKNALLTVNGIEKFFGSEIYLIDKRLKKFHNLRVRNKIEVSGNQKNNEYSLLVGSPGFIKTFKKEYLPKEFSLYQNYPNPFNPSTFIRYQIPRKANASIKVYDILGNLVKILADEIKETGVYEVEFDGSELSSGIYFYELESGFVKYVKKMILVK